MSQETRYDRQLLIDGWNQESLASSIVGVIADVGIAASSYVLSAASLGINEFHILDPGNFSENKFFLDATNGINENIFLDVMNGYLTHKGMFDFFDQCDYILDFSNYALANKIAINKMSAFPEGLSGLLRAKSSQGGLSLFSYAADRNWSVINDLIADSHFPNEFKGDPVLDIISAGIALEETAFESMHLKKTSERLISYSRPVIGDIDKNQNILVAGAGAVGGKVALALAYSGFKNVTFMDPDIAELTNLNRQTFLYGSVGKSKARTLAKKFNSLGMNTSFKQEYFDANTSLENYDVVFDCVDDFQPKITLSEVCKQQNTLLISGGTNITTGQAVYFNPQEQNAKTPAQQLKMYDRVKNREPDYQRERTSCSYKPTASVIMTNQIIAGFMVDMYRQILAGQKPQNIFYDSYDDNKFK